MKTAVERQIPLLDLRAQFASLQGEMIPALMRVVESQKFILGEDVDQLEQEVASYCRAHHAVGCASGSDALSLALMALGIQPGDEVLTSPFTFFATAGEICRAGAKPVFVDIEPATFNMDMNRVESALRNHPRIRAVIPVHLFGGCADMDALTYMTRERDIPVIEDAAQSIGAEYKGCRAGSIGDVGCFSFFPSKNLGGYGDGGMITTQDKTVADRLKALRVHGRTGAYVHDWIGINSRLDTLQAAVLRVKLRHLDEWTARRRENAARYLRLLSGAGIPVCVPHPAPYQIRHVYNQFVIRCERRDQLQAYLKERGIGTGVYYPLSLHEQPCFASLGYQAGDFPASEKTAAEVLALPVNPEVSAEDIEYVCESIRSFYGGLLN
jgi:dTDP-4-amino-4,6-dideoxygalactose transaminase